MRITKRTREEAALICAIAASSAPPSWIDACVFIGANLTARWLAEQATMVATNRSYHAETLAYYAEAEALIRTGWSP